MSPTIYDFKGRVSYPPKLRLTDAAQELRDGLDREHAAYLNPKYQPDPSLWTQAKCNRFNVGVDNLLQLLRKECAADYEILDQQIRYFENPVLTDYLTSNPDIKALC